MAAPDFTTSLLVDETPEKVFNAINDVPAWWLANFEGSSKNLNDEFEVRYDNLHRSRHRIIEIIPDKKIVWLITDSHLSFLHDKSEWTGTTVTFEISKAGSQTEVRFTHQGLVPGVECFDACTNGWNQYLHGSLLKLITTGSGNPGRK